MQKYAVKTDLSNFFDDERKNVLVLVDPNWENVAALQCHIENMFKLDCLGLLTEDGLFLPPQEQIAVVKFTKSLKVFRADEQATIPQGTAFGDEKVENKKRKFCSSSTPNLSKRLKGTVTVPSPKKKKKKNEYAKTALSNGHVFFNDEEESEQKSLERNETEQDCVKFLCALSKRSLDSPRTFHINRSGNDDEHSDKGHVQIQQVVVLETLQLNSSVEPMDALSDALNESSVIAIESEEDSIQTNDLHMP